MSDDFLVSLKMFNQFIEVDKDKMIATIQSGAKLSKVIKILKEKYELAFPSLGSVTGQTIGGLLSTAVHGTGYNIGGFPSMVISFRVLDSNGNLFDINEENDNDTFKAVLVGLGCTGIILDVTFQLKKLFHLSTRSLPVSIEYLFDNLINLAAYNEYFRAWIIPYTNKAVIWMGNETIVKNNKIGTITYFQSIKNYFRRCLNSTTKFFFELSLLGAKYVPLLLPFINKIYFFFQMNFLNETISVYDEALTIDCLFDQYVSEWAIPIKNSVNALKEIIEMIKTRNDADFPIEIRFVDREKAFLSPSNDSKVCYIGVIRYRPFGIPVKFEDYFDSFQKIMIKYKGKPHWAKRFKLGESFFRENYKNWDKFNKVRKKLDPDGLFVNKRIECFINK